MKPKVSPSRMPYGGFRQSILQAIVEYSRIVRLPLNKVGSYNKVNEAFLNFVQEFEREPTYHEELAELLEMTPKEVANMLKGNTARIRRCPLSGEDGDSNDAGCNFQR